MCLACKANYLHVHYIHTSIKQFGYVRLLHWWCALAYKNNLQICGWTVGTFNTLVDIILQRNEVQMMQLVAQLAYTISWFSCIVN